MPPGQSRAFLRVIKRRFDGAKARYPGLKKNTAQLLPLFALLNPWMMHDKLLAEQA